LDGDFVKTGIEGLDQMLNGGIPRGNQVVLAGGPGAGKTLLSFEFLYRNAKTGNTSLLFALEEEPERVLMNAKKAFTSFTDIDELVKSKKLIIDGEDLVGVLRSGASSDSSQYEFGKIVSDIESLVSSSKANAIVIDSISVLDLLLNEPLAYRRSMLALASNLRRLGITSILTSELQNPERSKLQFQTEFFLFDGIIVMYGKGEEEKREQAMEVIKMRGTKHSFVTTPYDITQDGINVITPEDMAL
jgi:KaiC/GvpD/RAD55 family RecA-like ATPase